MSRPDGPAGGVDPARVAALTRAEQARFVAEHPRSRQLSERARSVMPGGVPMSWMTKWPGPFPLFVAEASGAHFRDVDGRDYVDLCLGDTGAMTGHSPAPTVDTVREQVGRGITTMLPTEDAVVVAAELRRRFGLPLWQFTLSATDANRHAIRYARHVT
ncbi:MAG: aminotransferase class III-fold pyridoxal phosphate-dependent enzyme, partial [Actinomycetes bacterium]